MDKNYRMSRSLKKLIALMRVTPDQRKLMAEADAYYTIKRRSAPVKRDRDDGETPVATS